MNFKEFKDQFQIKEVTEYSGKVPTDPLVSVCIQTYQHKNYIKECLEGILLQQTSFHYEILLGEDSSTDGTREVCIEFAKRYPHKIRLFLHKPENKLRISGIMIGNFNAFYNFYEARGKFIAFCEGDDVWCDPLKLEKQVDFLNKNPSYAFTYHGFRTINSTGQNLVTSIEQNQPRKDLSQQDLMELKYHPLLLTLCFRNKIIDFPREMIEVINADAFLLSILGTRGAGKFQEEIIPALYRRHTGGVWSSRKQQEKFTAKILTFEKLSSFYCRTGNSKMEKVFSEKIKLHLKMLILFYLRRFYLISTLRTLYKFWKNKVSIKFFRSKRTEHF